MPPSCTPQPIKINIKYMEIIHNYIVEQNKQLLKCIADDENLDYNELISKYIMSKSKFHAFLMNHN